MANATEQLNNVLEKTRYLMALCRSLQEENNLLKEENVQQKQALIEVKNDNFEAEEKIRLLKLAKSIEGTSEKTLDIKQKINEFVREIDKCVALLKK